MRATGIVIASCVLAASVWAQEVREFPATAGGELALELDAGGSVEVVGSSATQVRVEWEIEGTADRIAVDAEATAGGVRVRSRYLSRRVGRGEWPSVRLRVSVPARYDVRLASVGGSLEIGGVEGTMSGETKGGSLVLRRVRGKLDLKTFGGDVEVADCEVDGTLVTMGGDVELRDVTGDLATKSMGGDITYDIGRRGQGEVKVETLGGDIEVRRAAAGVNVQTNGGDIEVRSASDHVKALTMGGDIEIEQVDGWIEAKTMSGDIRVKVLAGSGRRDVELTTYSGGVELTVPAGFGMTVDIETSGGDDWRERGIESDFDLEIERGEEPARRRTWREERDVERPVERAHGTIGSGEHRVKIRALNGQVALRRQ